VRIAWRNASPKCLQVAHLRAASPGYWTGSGQIVVSILHHSAFAHSAARKKCPPSLSAARGILKDNEVLLSRENRTPQAQAIPPLRAENPQRRESGAERGEFELPVQIAEQPDDNVMWGSGAHTKCRDRPRLKHTVGYTVGNIQRRPSLRARSTRHGTELLCVAADPPGTVAVLRYASRNSASRARSSATRLQVPSKFL
jgi:hypothetical protein